MMETQDGSVMDYYPSRETPEAPTARQHSFAKYRGTDAPACGPCSKHLSGDRQLSTGSLLRLKDRTRGLRVGRLRGSKCLRELTVGN